jgi:alpha-mannosidase
MLMKKLQSSLILLSCHSLDDFPVYHQGEDASSLLSSWTALWHPLLLVATQELPGWNRIDDPPEDCSNRVIVAPQVNYADLPTGFPSRVEEEGGRLIQGVPDRSAVVGPALEYLDAATPLPETWVGDFHALGYAYLQVQLLTRHMRYASNLDVIHFGKQAVAAAQAALDQDNDRTRELLQRCFDILTEEREHFYPVDALLMDMVLLPPEVDQREIKAQLTAQHPINVHAPGEVIETWAQDADVGRSMTEAVSSGRWSLLGGEAVEARTQLLSQESLIANFRQGTRQFESAVGKRPSVFARRRFGLSWAYPQLLKSLGYAGAVHATLDDGRFPEGLHLKTTWEGNDGSPIDAFARIPFDASLPETYLTLAIKLGEMLDSDHAAGICLVHWPGTPCPWYDDLVRVHHYCGAIGKFVCFEEFFREINDSGIADRFQADQYRSPFLQQAVVTKQTNPLSRQMAYWKSHFQATATDGLKLLADVISGSTNQSQDGHESVWKLDEDPENGARESVDSEYRRQQKRVATVLSGSGEKGWLIVNPFGTVRRAGLKFPASTPIPKAERPIYAADRSGDQTCVVVDVPAMGYVWIPANGKDAAVKTGPSLGEDFLLRNEFFETTIDRHTGGLRTFHEYNIRGNRLSQQLALRLSSGGEQGHFYTLMQADTVETVCSNMACAEIVSRGRLVHPNGERTAAEFEQKFRVWRGSRILEMDVEVRPEETLRADPWNSYFCQRLVWKDQAADLYRDVNQVRWFGGNKRLEAPQFVELEMDPRRTTLFTGGLPYHRRHHLNQLDTLLQVRGESAQQFRLGLGLDVPNPAAAATLFGSELTVLQEVACPPNGPTGWLFHIDARSVIATHWESVGAVDHAPEGFRVRLLETMGRPAKVRLSAVQEAVTARKVNLLGDEVESCEVVDGQVRLGLEAHELATIEVSWKS